MPSAMAPFHIDLIKIRINADARRCVYLVAKSFSVKILSKKLAGKTESHSKGYLCQKQAMSGLQNIDRHHYYS